MLAEGVDLGGGEGVVDCCEDHCDSWVVEVLGEEVAVDVGYEFLGDAVSYFGDEAGGGGYDGDEGVGVEEVEDAAGGDLIGGGISMEAGVEGRWGDTFPPPTTTTRRLRTCQARRREPPGCTAGNSSAAAAIE